ncbi:MAG: UDP-N-acetylmuramoyl-L-alanyl-D-glutamate--2,6-diaminopimelate ligase, partial [Burkholderiales bacterium PBB4]
MTVLTSPQEAVRWFKEQGSRSLHSDSRQVQAGDAFLAWPGGLRDPREHVANALANGAVACLVEQSGADAFNWHSSRVAVYAGLKADAGYIASEFFGNPSHDLAMLAITGTNGKTSTAWWLAQAMTALPGAAAMACGLVGTLGVGLAPGLGSPVGSLATDLVPTGFTTPDPVVLQRTLRQFIDSGLKA